MPVNSFGDPIEAPHGGAGPQVLNSFGDPVELPGPPKAPIPQGLAEPFSQKYGLTAAQRADVRSRDTRGLEEIGGATLIPAASGAVRASAAGEPILPAVVQSAKNLGTSMVSGTVAALGARKAAKYLGAPEGVADAAAIIGGLYGAKAGGSVSEYLSAEKGIPSTWKFLKWLRNRPATTVPEPEEPETPAPSTKPASAAPRSAASPAEAPAPAAGKPTGTAADMMNAEYGPSAPAAPASVPKSPGQVLYESDARPTDVPWERVPKDQQAMFEQFAARPTSAAGVPPPSPTPSAPRAQTTSAAPTVLQPNGGPLRPPLAPQPATAAPSIVSAARPETPPPEVVKTANRTFVKDARPSAEDYTLMEVPTAKLDAGWSKEGPAFYIPPGGGGAEIGGRLARAREFIQSGTPVEAPRVSMAENGRIAFEDGRHRFAAMRDAGDPTVGVMVPHEQVADFQSLSKPALDWSVFQGDEPPVKPGLTKDAYKGAARGTRADRAGSLANILDAAGTAADDLNSMGLKQWQDLAAAHDIDLPTTKAAQSKLFFDTKMALRQREIDRSGTGGTIKPSPGFSMGEMKNYRAQPATAAPSAVPSAAPADIDWQQRYGEQEQPEVTRYLGHDQPAATVNARPSLGNTGRDIYQGWKELAEGSSPPRAVIEGFVPGVGRFDWRNGQIVRLSKQTGRTGIVSTYSPASSADIAAIHDAIDKGQFQVEQRTISGAGGVRNFAGAGALEKVFHQATGRPLPEFLNMPEGQAWAKRVGYQPGQ